MQCIQSYIIYLHTLYIRQVLYLIACFPLQNGDSFESGYENRIRVWLFIGFVLGFSSIIAATWIMIADFTIIDEKASKWPGIALLLQNVFIFFSSLLYKFGRQSGDTPYGF